MQLVRDPIYQQLAAALRVLAAQLGPATRFPAERALAERYGVSRATANKAVAALVGEGVLVHRKGLGTFVAARPAGVEVMRYDLRELVSFTERAKAAGKTPLTRVLHFETEPPPPVVAAHLGATPLLHLLRLRLADDVPLILEDRYVVRELCPAMTRSDAEGSLYAYWSDHVGLRITDAVQTVTAAAASSAEAAQLGLQPGEPVLCVTAVGNVDVSGGRRPLWWERTLYRADLYVFEATLSGLGGRGVVLEHTARRRPAAS